MDWNAKKEELWVQFYHSFIVSEEFLPIFSMMKDLPKVTWSWRERGQHSSHSFFFIQWPVLGINFHLSQEQKKALENYSLLSVSGGMNRSFNSFFMFEDISSTLMIKKYVTSTYLLCSLPQLRKALVCRNVCLRFLEIALCLVKNYLYTAQYKFFIWFWL